MHGTSFKNRNFVWSETLALRAKDSLKLNKAKNRLNIILYYSFQLNTCEYLICQIYQ